MLGDVSGISKVILVTGYTDMRKGLESLKNFIESKFNLDPYSRTLFLFCGRRCDRIKGLYHDRDGFVMLYMILDGEGRFQWPRNGQEARTISRQEYRWLLEGLSIDQKKVIKPSSGRKDG